MWWIPLGLKNLSGVTVTPKKDQNLTSWSWMSGFDPVLDKKKHLKHKQTDRNLVCNQTSTSKMVPNECHFLPFKSKNVSKTRQRDDTPDRPTRCITAYLLYIHKVLLEAKHVCVHLNNMKSWFTMLSKCSLHPHAWMSDVKVYSITITIIHKPKSTFMKTIVDARLTLTTPHYLWDGKQR